MADAWGGSWGASTGSGIPAVNQPVIVWPHVPAAISYNVQRSPHGAGTFTVIATGLTDPWYIDASADLTLSWDYEVSAVNAAGASAWTPAATYNP